MLLVPGMPPCAECAPASAVGGLPQARSQPAIVCRSAVWVVSIAAASVFTPGCSARVAASRAISMPCPWWATIICANITSASLTPPLAALALALALGDGGGAAAGSASCPQPPRTSTATTRATPRYRIASPHVSVGLRASAN
jgi:hypothetical protein